MGLLEQRALFGVDVGSAAIAGVAEFCRVLVVRIAPLALGAGHIKKLLFKQVLQALFVGAKVPMKILNIERHATSPFSVSPSPLSIYYLLLS